MGGAVTDKEKQTVVKWSAVMTGAACALFLAMITGGLQIWSNDGRQDVKIQNISQHADENATAIKDQGAKTERAVEKLERLMRDSDSRFAQGLGEIRALILQLKDKEK